MHSKTAGYGVIIPIPEATAALRVVGNHEIVSLSIEEKEQLDDILRPFDSQRKRQILEMESILWT